jgi:hypothetical protein
MRSLAFFSSACAALLTAFAHAQTSPQIYRDLEEHVPHGFRPFMALDVDVDGALDLVAPEGVLKNDGTGRFTPLPVAPAVASALFFADVRVALDVNGDGFDDLVVVAPNAALTRTCYALLSGPGGLTAAAPAPPFPAGDAPTALAAFDYDGDGFDDLVAGATQTAPAAVWHNVFGTVFVDVTTFLPVPPFPNGWHEPAAAGDFDGDGSRDVLLVDLAAPGGIVLSAASGAFVVAPVSGQLLGFTISDVVVGAFDSVPGDDVLGNAFLGSPFRFGIRYVAGVPTYQPLGPVLQIPSGTAPIDLDGDGVDELAYVDAPLAAAPSLHVVADLFGAATSTTVMADAPEPAFSFDADGDGDRDLLAMRAKLSPRIVFVGAAQGLYEARSDLNYAAANVTAPMTVAALVGDFDGDGDVDAARFVGPGCPGAPIAVLENDGRGRFPSPAVSDLCVQQGWFTAAAVADFDGDGRDDVVRARTQSSVFTGLTTELTLFRSTAGGWIETPLGVEPGSAVAVRVADVGQDGDPDVVVATSGPAQFAIYANAGGAFARSVVAIGGQIDEAVVADVTGDGTPDFLFSSLATSVVPLAKMVNGATLSPPAIIGNGTRIGVADFDGDGDADLLLDATVRENLGGGLFPIVQTLAGYPLPAAGPFLPSVVLDANADGDPDVLAYGALWLGGPGTTFGAPQTVPFPAVGIVQTAVMPQYRAADFDRDGDLDLLDPIGRLISNATRHLALGAPASIGRTGSLEAYGPPFQPCDVFASFNAFAQNPIAVPGWGNLFLVPEDSVYVGAFGTDGTGRAVVPFVVPNVPALAGLTLHWQAALPLAGKLTNAEVVRVLAL